MPTFTVVPVADYINKAWTPSSGTDHYALIDEDISSPDESDYVEATAENKNDRYDLSDNLPPLLKEVTKITYEVHVNGKSGGIDAAFQMQDSSAAVIDGFFKTASFDTSLTWKTRAFDKTAPTPVDRSRFASPFKVLMQSRAMGTGDPPDTEE